MQSSKVFVVSVQLFYCKEQAFKWTQYQRRSCPLTLAFSIKPKIHKCWNDQVYSVAVQQNSMLKGHNRVII